MGRKLEWLENCTGNYSSSISLNDVGLLYIWARVREDLGAMLGYGSFIITGIVFILIYYNKVYL